jgi:hypothetical protein
VSGDRPDELLDRAYRPGDASAAPGVAAPLGDRTITIRVLGIVQIVFGALCSVAAMVGLVAMSAIARGPALAAALVYAIPAANLLATGIGSVRIARWARRATLISAFVWLALIGVAGAAVTFGRIGGMGYELVLVGGLLILALAFAIVLIVSYTRPAVRATFERRQDP